MRNIEKLGNETRIEIEGVAYSWEFLEAMSNAGPEWGEPFQLRRSESRGVELRLFRNRIIEAEI